MHEIRSTILSGGEKESSPVARKGKPRREGAPLGGLSKIAIRRQEARVTDQRREDRLRDVVQQSVVHYRRRKHPVRVVNVSSRGAMIESDLEPWIGAQLDIQFSGDSRTRCVVRWVREGRIGLEFVNETIFWETDQADGPVFHAQRDEPAGGSVGASPAPARPVVDREHRHSLLRNGLLYWSGISIPVRLRNISSGGARVESEQELRPGAEVELDLGEAGFQVAEVRWAKDGQVGLRFADEFDIGSLAPAHTETGPAADMLKPAYLETELRPDSPWAARFERLSTTDLKIINPEG